MGYISLVKQNNFGNTLPFHGWNTIFSIHTYFQRNIIKLNKEASTQKIYDVQPESKVNSWLLRTTRTTAEKNSQLCGKFDLFSDFISNFEFWKHVDLLRLSFLKTERCLTKQQSFISPFLLQRQPLPETLLTISRETKNAASDLVILKLPQSFDFSDSTKFFWAFLNSENGVGIWKLCTVLKYS